MAGAKALRQKCAWCILKTVASLVWLEQHGSRGERSEEKEEIESSPHIRVGHSCLRPYEFF